MAVLRMRLIAPVDEEVGRLWNAGDPPRWVVRTLETRRAPAGRPLASALVEALGEQLGRRLQAISLLLRRAEARGWRIELDGGELSITTGMSPEATRRALEEDGVWLLVRRMDEAGEARLLI